MVRRRVAERSPGRAERMRSQGVGLGVGPRPVVRCASAVKRRGDEVPTGGTSRWRLLCCYWKLDVYLHRLSISFSNVKEKHS